MWVGEPTIARGGDEMTVGEYSAWRKRRDYPTPATGFRNTHCLHQGYNGSQPKQSAQYESEESLGHLFRIMSCLHACVLVA